LQHPNQYFEKSREFRTGEKMETKASGGGGAPLATATATTTAAAPAAVAEMTDEDLLAAMDFDGMDAD